MRTAIILAGGLALLGVFALAGWRLGGGAPSMVTAAKIFIPVWLAATLLNMWLGVARAGYSVAEELPIFLVLFIIPAAVAGFLWWKYS
jgi:hypothetical protein